MLSIEVKLVMACIVTKHGERAARCWSCKKKNYMQAHHVCEMHTQAGMEALMERSFHPVLQTCTGHLIS